MTKFLTYSYQSALMFIWNTYDLSKILHFENVKVTQLLDDRLLF